MIIVSYEVATERQPMVFILPLAVKYQQYWTQILSAVCMVCSIRMITNPVIWTVKISQLSLDWTLGSYLLLVVALALSMNNGLDMYVCALPKHGCQL